MVRKQALSIAGVAAVLVLGGGPAAYAGGGPGGHGGDRGDRGCQGGQRHGGQEQGGTPKIACQLPPRDQTALRTCRVGHHDVGYA
ncbi:MAG: hypothetical protein ACJ76T_05065, partial [Solirubrobacteraceae bacterium]